MLSDAESKKNKSSGKARSIYAGTNKQWSDAQKTEAVKTYLLLGNLAMTSRMLGIPEVTLRLWKTTQWWQDVYHELKSQEKLELNRRLKKIVEASLAVVEDRLVHGDYQFDQKTGEVIRKPVNMKDAHKVAVDLQQRQDILEKTAEV
jgi:transposase-like protein